MQERKCDPPRDDGIQFMAIGMWCGTSLWAATHPGMEGTADCDLCCIWWALAPLAMLLSGARLCLRIAGPVGGWVIRRLRRPARPPKPEHHIVTQAMRIPSASPGKQQIIAALHTLAAKYLGHAQ